MRSGSFKTDHRLPGAVLVALEEARVAAGVAGDRRLAGAGCLSTLSKTTSLSQSRRSSFTFCTLPLSSPFFQRRPRDRLQ